jgi:hypothetical protein
MPMLRPLPVFILLLPLAAGCTARGSIPLGQLIVAHEADGNTTVVEAPRQTTYALYQPPAPDNVNSTPEGKVHLQLQVASGEPIGFEKAQTGDLQAVAGEKRIPLSEGEYAWRYSESKAILPRVFNGKVGKTLETAWQPTVEVLQSALTVVGVVLYFCPFLR